MSDDPEVPRRVLEAEARRDFRYLLSRSSLGCPRGECEHALGWHAGRRQGFDDDGMPIDPWCMAAHCTCGRDS